MNIKIGVMGSATEPSASEKVQLWQKGAALAQAIASRNVVLLTGATTGIVYVVGKAARDAGVFHIGISPAVNSEEHADHYKLPVDACNALIYTGFGLKGRNVVLVRSCDIVVFIAGGMGSLNEFTIAHDEGKIIGCLIGTGGVADHSDDLLKNFSRQKDARVFRDDDPTRLLTACIDAVSVKSTS